MDDEALLRYSKQILLPQIDYEGQVALNRACVLIIGLGGLGCAVAQYLASSGVGTLILLDDDRVELANLPRQILHHSDDVGCYKVESAKETLLALNPTVNVITIAQRLEDDSHAQAFTQCDIVCDGSDNFSTRRLINRLCVQHKKPLVQGAVTGFEGQVALYEGHRAGCPCYECVFPFADSDLDVHDTPCSAQGIISPLAGVVGNLQAIETIKHLTGIRQTLSGQMLVLNTYAQAWHKVKLTKDRACLVCCL